jgi:hypothetical protein
MQTLEERVASMPTGPLRRPCGLIAVSAVAMLLAVPPIAGAKVKTVSADLRVVGPSGQTLAELTQYTSSVQVPTDPNALCFGPGTGGSGSPVTVPGATALGLVQDGSATARELRPLSVTDAFDFGLGVCGIGGFQAQGSASWYLKHNHAGAQVGGDQLPIANGDDVLWYLAPTFPYPPELGLEAPPVVDPGSQVEVQAVQYADDSTRTPAAGATVSGGGSPVTTDAQGRANVALGSGVATLQATRGADIPSNEVSICVAESARDCAPQQEIAGTRRPDRIKGTELADKIKAKDRNDRVRARGGAPDRINCGTGKRDVAVVDRDDTLKACEKVKVK